MLADRLNDYIFDTENDIKNFRLAQEYEKIGQTASAIGLYLRCAEITDNAEISYEALLRMGICYIEQGERDAHVEIAYNNAIGLLPYRPEGYNLMSRFYELRGEHHNLYMWARMGLTKANFNLTPLPLSSDMQYKGKQSFLLQEALGAWYIGRFEESRKKYSDLYLVPDLDKEIKQAVENSLHSIIRNDKMDIVLQGQYSHYAYETALQYIQLDFLDRVILSCWEDDEVPDIQNSDIVVIKNKYPDSHGTGNRNLQIVSSLAGIKATATEFVVKMRNDQRYDWKSMITMKNYFEEHKERELTYSNDETKPKNKSLTAGAFPTFAFHPRDHVFWGNRSDLLDLFDIPLEPRAIDEIVKMPKEDYWKYYDHYIRTESYIGSHYAANFDEKIKTFLLAPDKYLHDKAPKYREALALSNKLMDKGEIFKSFPKEGIDLKWPKYNWETYPYETQKEKFNERWAEDGY